MADDAEVEKALQKAYRLLTVRARSEQELRSKLRERKFDDRVVDQAISRLYELNYLDDAVFARQWVRRLAIEKLSGDRRIETSLREKGLSRTVYEPILAEIRQDMPEKEAIRQLIRKKLKGARLQKYDGREKRRLAQNLLGRGFAPDLIYEMIREAEAYRDDDRQSD